MGLKGCEALDVRQVGNGFIVSLSMSEYGRRDMAIIDQDTRVFQTMAELGTFLSSHFNHRNNDVLVDSIVDNGPEAEEQMRRMFYLKEIAGDHFKEWCKEQDKLDEAVGRR